MGDTAAWGIDDGDGRWALLVPAPAAVTAGFDELFAREYVPMVRLAVLLLGNEEEAEEVVQEAFAAVHERWDRLDRPGGYLRRCVVNRCRDLQRRRGIARRLGRVQGPAREATEELGADDLFDALAVLPPRRRAAVVLRFYEGRSEAEIAEILGVRPGTVKSLLHRALAELREVLER